MKAINKNFINCRHPEDAERIQKILLNNGYTASPKECERLWEDYSDSMAAGWMGLPEKDEDVFWRISGYLDDYLD